MAQQKYSYPGTGVGEIEALYRNPNTPDGVTTVQDEIADNSMLFDRVISNTLTLPYD